MPTVRNFPFLTRIVKLRKARSLALAVSGGHAVLLGYLVATGDDKFYHDVLMPAARYLVTDGEQAHNIMVKLCGWGLVPRSQYTSERLKTKVIGLQFSSPIGMAAGFDKNGDALPGVYRLGFSHDEVGSITPLAQPGNPQPRVFRLNEDMAIINRYGFPSVGHAKALSNIQRNAKYKNGPLGVNLGANKDTADVVEDFVRGVDAFKDVADYFVINVSSPNTPGLRLNQQRDKLVRLLTAVLKARDSLSRRIPLLLKIAPDLTDEEKRSVAETVLQLGIDGLIVCNTTISRPEGLRSRYREETGGLSGLPLRDMSLNTLRTMYSLTGGRVAIIGVGGIWSGDDAYRRIRAGASLVQVYTSFTYEGPPLITRVKKDLDALLERDGFKSVSDAVGVDNRLTNGNNASLS